MVYAADYDNLGRLETAYTHQDLAAPAEILKFNYGFEADSRNISSMEYDHCANDPDVTFTYDDLDRLIEGKGKRRGIQISKRLPLT